MEQIKIGDRVKMVSRSTGEDIGVEGTLNRYVLLDEYADVIIDGKSHDMTDEGDSYNLVKVYSEKDVEEAYDKGYDDGIESSKFWGYNDNDIDKAYDKGYDAGFEDGLEGH